MRLGVACLAFIDLPYGPCPTHRGRSDDAATGEDIETLVLFTAAAACTVGLGRAYWWAQQGWPEHRMRLRVGAVAVIPIMGVLWYFILTEVLIG